jgi:hypothetical protein
MVDVLGYDNKSLTPQGLILRRIDVQVADEDLGLTGELVVRHWWYEGCYLEIKESVAKLSEANLTGQEWMDKEWLDGMAKQASVG